MGIPTESVIGTYDVDRVATLRLVRVVDYEALAESHGGSVTKEQIQNAGDYEVVIEPNARDSKEIRRGVESRGEGLAFMAGFEACADLKKRKPRAANGSGNKLDRMTKADLVALAGKKKIDIGKAKTKPEIVAAITAGAN